MIGVTAVLALAAIAGLVVMATHGRGA
jgi:hypothetical protein